jgi:acyl-CoA reductase-like NAD-dependent aldehyde dehydrogenase
VTVAVTPPEAVERAVAAAQAAAKLSRALPAHRRAPALTHVSARITARAGELAELICTESGKPLKWARAEVERGSFTFRWAAEEARRWSAGALLSRGEVFGPVMVVERVRDLSHGLARINDRAYGLQPGVLTPRPRDRVPRPSRAGGRRRRRR